MKNFSTKLRLTGNSGLLGLFLILLVYPLHAQHMISGGIGANTYIGELSPDGSSAQLNGSFYYHNYFEDRFFVRAGFNFGSIEGSFEPGDQFINRNSVEDPTTFFNADIFTGDVSFNMEVIRLGFGHIYGGIGFGVLTFNLEDREGRNLEQRSRTRFENESFSSTVASVPLNVGIILFQNNKINLMLEQTWILTNTDYLDNIGYAGQEGTDSIIRRSLNIRFQF